MFMKYAKNQKITPVLLAAARQNPCNNYEK